MLKLTDLQAFYGKSHVVHGVSLELAPGEIVGLLGRNGSGRSTLVKAIMGLVQGQGSATWCGTELLGKKPFEIARLGLGYVPESRDVFPSLTVHQNLLMGQKPGPSTARRAPRWSFDDVYRMCPQLLERRNTEAGVLSGGEQQMLALCRTLMGDPDLVMIDEPTEGMAPMLVGHVARQLREMADRGLAVLLVEQKQAIALDVCRRCLVMGRGRIVFEGAPDELRADARVVKEWLGI